MAEPVITWQDPPADAEHPFKEGELVRLGWRLPWRDRYATIERVSWSPSGETPMISYVQGGTSYLVGAECVAKVDAVTRLGALA